MPEIPMGRQRPRVQWHKGSAPASASQLALITFIVLKLVGVITWSWWWVLSPMWISGILFVLGVGALLIGFCWHVRRQTRLWMNQMGPQILRDFMDRRDPDASGVDLGLQDGGGKV